MTSLLAVLAILLCSTCVMCKDKEVKVNDITLKVKGHSGKIQIGMTKPREKDFTLEFDQLVELDVDGDPVKCTGHKVQTFANTDFTFNPDDTPINVKFQNLSTSYFNFSAGLRENAVFTAHVYLFKENGSYSLNGEEVFVLVGDVKINVQLDDWQWCGLGAGEDAQMGGGKPGKKLQITVQTKGKTDKDLPKKRTAGEERANGRKVSKGPVEEFDLGDDTVLVMSSKAVVDDVVLTMNPAPSLKTQGAKTLVSFTFPKGQKVGKSLFYDPVAQLADSGASLAASLALVFVGQLLARFF